MRHLAVRLFALGFVLCVLPGYADRSLPVPVSPGAVDRTMSIGDRCPAFSWGSADGAEYYDLAVYDVGSAAGEARLVLSRRIPGSALSWTPALGECLVAGGRYAWTIRATSVDGDSSWSRPNLFEVASGPSRTEFEEALGIVRRFLEMEGAEQAAVTGPIAESGSTDDSPDPTLRSVEAVPAALGGADFSIDSSGNVEGMSFTGSGAGLTGVDAVTLNGLDSADFTTEAELASHEGDDSAHHPPTVNCNGAACDGSLFTGVDADTLDSLDSSAFLQKTEFDAEAELEAALADVTNVLTDGEKAADADLLDGMDSTVFMSVVADDWVDEAGDTMSGKLTLDPASGVALETGVGDHVDLGGDLLLRGHTFLRRSEAGTAIGHQALGINTASVGGNIAIGSRALATSTTGRSNTGIGTYALEYNYEGSSNTALGGSALQISGNGSSNAAIGHLALRNSTGSSNIALGARAGYAATTGGDNIFIGNEGLAAEAAKIRIGTQGTQTATYVAGISGVTPAGAAAVVVVDGSGQLGSTSTVADGVLGPQVAHLDVAETITANWVNAANPWADNEVADTLTIGASGSVANGALDVSVSLLGQTIENSEITDGTGSGLDADLLDGVHGSQFLRSDTSDTMTGILTLSTAPGTGNSLLARDRENTRLGSMHDNSANAIAGVEGLGDPTIGGIPGSGGFILAAAKGTSRHLSSVADNDPYLHIRHEDDSFHVGHLSPILTVNAQTSRVGVGLTSPEAKLHIKGTGQQLDLEDSASGSERHIAQLSMTGNTLTIAANHVSGTPTLGMTLGVRNAGSYVEAQTITGDGKVGIGVASPAEKLDVAGNVKATSFIGDGAGLTNVPPAAHEHSGADITAGTVGEPHIGDALARDSEVSAAIAGLSGTYVDEAGDTMTGTLTLNPSSGYALVTSAGNVGIGVPAPNAPLAVAGNISARIADDTRISSTHTNSANSIAGFEAMGPGSSTPATGGFILAASKGTFKHMSGVADNDPYLYLRHTDDRFHIGDESPIVTVDAQTSRVGIGVTNPGAKLDIAGNVKIVDGTQGVGKVLTSDASGLASWQTGSSGVPSGAVMYFNLASCPSGWTALTGAQGRYLVGVPSGGTLAASVGTALSNQENRVVGLHTHGASSPAHSHNYQRPASSNTADAPDGGSTVPVSTPTTAASTDGTFPTITVFNSGTVSGTNAPYLQLLVCQKS